MCESVLGRRADTNSPNEMGCFQSNTRRLGGKLLNPQNLFMKLHSKASYPGMKHMHLGFISRARLSIGAPYLQENILKLHDALGHQVGTKPETASIGEIHHCLGDGKCNSKDMCFPQRVSEKKTF